MGELSFHRVFKTWKPPPTLTVSKWADEFRILSSSSAEPGKWKNSRSPYMVEIMDALSDKRTTQIVMKTSAQIGKTELINNCIGYYMSQDPCSMLMVQPTQGMAESWVKERLNPMLDDCPIFKDLLTENNLTHKSFIGGFLAIGYAKSPSTLSSRPIRIVFFDEVDRYDLNINKEGDPINQGLSRTKTFTIDKKSILVSTPKIKGSSRIDILYNDTDQRIYKVPCPCCNDFHFLKFDDIKFNPTDPLDAVWVCPSCANKVDHKHKKQMLTDGKWSSQQPFSGKAGFHINELYSPWVTWGEVAKSYLDAKKSEEIMQTWVNLSMGMSYEPKSQKIDRNTLASLKQDYDKNDLPSGILWISAGVDTQNDRFEVDIWGFGMGNESWHILTDIILGDPQDPSTRDNLDAFLFKKFKVNNRGELPISSAFIDSGGGRTKAVYDFVRGKSRRKIYAIKGASSSNPYDNEIEIYKQGWSKKYKTSLINLHVSKLKLQFYQALKKSLADEVSSQGENKGTNAVHFSKNCNTDFFKGIASEKLSRKTIAGKHLYFWEKTEDRNERLDCAIYARAALTYFKPDFKKLDQNLTIKPKKTTEFIKERPQKRKNRGSWVNNY